MKRWYKKVNRGLVLAMILIVGLVSYITVGTIQFNQQKESAKELIENYMEAVMKFAVDKRASNIQAEQLMGTYWEKKEMRLQDGGMDKEVFQMQMNQFLEEKNGNLEQLSGIMTDRSNYGRSLVGIWVRSWSESKARRTIECKYLSNAYKRWMEDCANYNRSLYG